MTIQFTPWQISEADYPHDGPLDERLRFLLRYAILAPSSHNTQPWRFRVTQSRIDLFLDYGGWLEVADDDQRELHISLGCVLETLLVAAEHFGLAHETLLMPDLSDVTWVATIEFQSDGQPAPFRPLELFQGIPLRHTNHSTYTDRRIPQELLQRFETCCFEPAVSIFLTEDQRIKECVDDLVVRGDAIEFADPAFRAELGHWIGQGVFGTSWLMSKMGQLAVRHLNLGRSQARKDSDALLSSPVVCVLCAQNTDRSSQIQVGQVYVRICLLAAMHGIWTQPMSQIVEIPELLQELANLVPIVGAIPQHPFRMGYAQAEEQHTPRKTVDQVSKV